jgi:hypothetical protein
MSEFATPLWFVVLVSIAGARVRLPLELVWGR